ncbi:MAG: DNA polymerase III subunit delta, partial [Gemmiger sp.]
MYYFYAAEEALVRTAAAKVEKALSEDDPETTVLDGPTPTVEEIVLAAGTISFFGGKRLVMVPLIRPAS